ncbi:hypothetical protein HPC38_05760 [Pasteurellaceae bacterium HPA106]|uniref:hypothetical protein n=1 Tax=Spirabiliibacterium pneumoniae TaxID=221400 RepID=UPI001AACC796|nr:hypothetical protein [Spirabiliibacterium pneumoniae]MBE2896378.1 hypothetical protein [Spirabiliibacterium pneumoniae]
MSDPLLTRFFRYLPFDCQTKLRGHKVQASLGQRALAELLCSELAELGLKEITLAKDGVLTALLPASTANKPTIGWLVNLATPAELNCQAVAPEILPCYRGGDISLGESQVCISPVQFPFMHQLHEHTLVIGDGKHGLGAQSKGAIALVMWVLEQLQHQVRGNNIRVAFVPDNGVALTADFFTHFRCDVLFSLQAEGVGQLAVENLYSANLAIQLSDDGEGNVLEYGCALQHYFSHHIRHGLRLLTLQGNEQQVKMQYHLTALEKAAFDQTQSAVERALDNARGAGVCATLQVYDVVENMAQCIANAPLACKVAERAVSQCGLTFASSCALDTPMGAYLARFGVACPSLSIGGFNFATRKALLSLQGMQHCAKVLLQMAVNG